MKSFEYHVGGQPVRVIVDGVPSPQGRTQAQKAAWFARHADRYRRGLVLAPRGHADMSAVLLTEPSSAHAHAGLVFLDAGGLSAVRAGGRDGRRGRRGLGARPDLRARCAAAPGAHARLRHAGGDGGRRARRPTSRRRDPCVVRGVPAFVYAAGLPRAAARHARCRWTSRSAASSTRSWTARRPACRLDVDHLPELRRIGARGLRRAQPDDHRRAPARSRRSTAWPASCSRARRATKRSHLRTVLVTAARRRGLVAGRTATAAVMAVLDAIGLLADAPSFTHEGLSGARVTGAPSCRASRWASTRRSSSTCRGDVRGRRASRRGSSTTTIRFIRGCRPRAAAVTAWRLLRSPGS